MYCSRTIPEIEKVVEELRNLLAYIATHSLNSPSSFHPPSPLALGGRPAEVASELVGLAVSSRKNLCVHPVASKGRTGKAVDGMCVSMTASFVRAKKASGEPAGACDFFEAFENGGGRAFLLPPGVYNLQELKDLAS